MFRDPFVASMLVANTPFFHVEFYLSKLEIFTQWGGLCLLSFGLFSRGSSFTGFTLCYSYQCPSLEGQAPKQLTNQQTSTIPVNPNNPGGSQYTQNYPWEIPTVGFYFYLPFLIFWSMFRTQNLSYWWINTWTSTSFPTLFIHQHSVLVPEQTSSRCNVLLEKDPVDLEETKG